MAITVIATTKVAGANGGTTPSFDSTGANCIAVWLAYGGSPTVTDSKGNTFTAGTAAGSAPVGRWYYCLSANVGTGHTVTIGGGSTASSAVVYALAGVAASAAYSSPGSTTLANGSSSAAFGVNIIPPEDNCIILQAFATGTATISAVTGANGWTLPQWTSGVGGTNYGSASAYKIQTTATTIASSEVYATWTGTEGGTQTVAIFKAAAAGPGLTISTPSAFEVHQRSGTTGSIQITGGYTGTPTAIEASFNGGPYQTIVASPSGGTFSATLTGQTQGQGNLIVRFTNDTGITATVANVGIGDVFAVGGDSISEGRGDNAQSYSHATLKAAKFRQDNLWAEGNDGIDTGTSIGSHWPLLATRIMADQGVPVAFISVGTGSTDVAGTYNEWAKPNSSYGHLTTQVANSTVSAVKAVLMHLGPNAVIQAATLSQATYNAAIDTFAANIATDIVGAPKLHIGIFGEVSTGSPPDRIAAINNTRAAIIEAQGNNSNVRPGPVLIDLDYSDGVHPATNAQLQAVADRWWLALSASLYGGSNGRGPRVNAANWNVARNQLTIVFDQVLKTGLTHSTACWSVSDNGTPMTVSSVNYHGSNPSALVINTSASAVGADGTTTVSFASANTSVGLVVPRGVDINMPGGGTASQPAEPIYSATVSEVDVTAPVLSSATASANSSTTATGSVTTNESNGILYRLISVSPTETAGNVVASGLTSNVVLSGSQSVSFTGLTPLTTYYVHYVHVDAAGNQSGLATTASFTTPATPVPSVSTGIPRVGLTASGQLIVLFP